MAADDADEVVLETEITNEPALRLYQALGFVRDKRLFRYLFVNNNEYMSWKFKGISVQSNRIIS